MSLCWLLYGGGRILGVSRFGFIDFDKVEDAERALKKFDGIRINGREIRLEFKKASDKDRDSFGYRSRGRHY